MDSHFLFQGIFPTQGSNRHLLHCRWILYRWATGKDLNIDCWSPKKQVRLKSNNHWVRTPGTLPQTGVPVAHREESSALPSSPPASLTPIIPWSFSSSEQGAAHSLLLIILPHLAANWRRGTVSHFHSYHRHQASRTFRNQTYWAVTHKVSFPGGARGNEPTNAGDIRDTSSIPGLERSPRGGHGNSLQYSCLENPHGKGDRWATVHGVAKIWTRLRTKHTRHTCLVPWTRVCTQVWRYRNMDLSFQGRQALQFLIIEKNQMIASYVPETYWTLFTGFVPSVS